MVVVEGEVSRAFQVEGRARAEVWNRRGKVRCARGEKGRKVWWKTSPQRRRAKLRDWHVLGGKIHSFSKDFPSLGGSSWASFYVKSLL